jgi:hypothetical protein
MFRRHTDLSWLGAEALPGDLAEINRVNQAWLDAAARDQRFVKEPRQRGLASIAIRWAKQRVTLAR